MNIVVLIRMEATSAVEHYAGSEVVYSIESDSFAITGVEHGSADWNGGVDYNSSYGTGGQAQYSSQ